MKSGRLSWRQLDPRRISREHIPWRLLPWGKIVGAVFGLPAGLFGILFGVIVGHLIDELLWVYIVRILIRRFLAGASRPPELERLAHPIAVLVVLSDAALCDGADLEASIEPVRRYLSERFARTPRDRRTLEIAADEVLGREQAPERAVEEWVDLLRARLAAHERAEVVWLAGRIARGRGSCARRRAEELADRFGVDHEVVSDAARKEGELDERACMLLGVPQDADREHVRRAYRRLAAQFHPDGTSALDASQQRQAGEAFIRIRAAYERLMRELGEEP
jgi:DnaJ like chaperone protein